MRKFLVALVGIVIISMLVCASSAYGQQYQVSMNGLSDSDKNQTWWLSYGGIHKTEPVLIPFGMEMRVLSDSVRPAEYNLKAFSGLRKLIHNNWYVDGRVGASLFDDEMTPIGSLTIGHTPIWNSKHPLGFNVAYNYEPYNYILSHAILDVNTSKLSGGVEYYPLNKVGIIVSGDVTKFTDSNRRETVETTLRWYGDNGAIVGAFGQFRTFTEERTEYWSPKYYDIVLAQVGYRTKWDADPIRTTVLLGIGQQQINKQESTVKQISAEFAGRVTQSGWAILNVMVSDGAGITSYSEDYQWLLITIGYRAKF